MGGNVGFEHDMNKKPNPVNHRRSEINANNPRPDKRQKQSKKQHMANTWRWTPKRREVAVKKATDCMLFDIKVDKGMRDAKISVIVSEMNQMTDVDVNFALLETTAYTKEIYRIQRKVLKINEDQLDILPEQEQLLYKQLKDGGHFEEASKARMEANSSFVSIIYLSMYTKRTVIHSPISIDKF